MAFDGEDLRVAADVGELVVVGAGLDPSAVAAHEFHLVGGGGGGGDGGGCGSGGRRGFVDEGGGAVLSVARARRGVAGIGDGVAVVILHGEFWGGFWRLGFCRCHRNWESENWRVGLCVVCYV